MRARPAPARWFEVLVSKEDVHATLETLAHSSRVQFEWTGEACAAEQFDALSVHIGRYRALAHSLGQFWPDPVFEKRCCPLPLEATAKAAVARAEKWREQSRPLLDDLTRLRAEREELDQWDEVLEAFSASNVDLGALCQAGPALAGYCLVSPRKVKPYRPAGVVQAETSYQDKVAVLGIAPSHEIERLCAQARTHGMRYLRPPDWFSESVQDTRAALAERVSVNGTEVQHLEDSLSELNQALEIGRAIGVLERLDWFQRTAERIRCDSQYCWITGWTSASKPSPLNQALRRAGVQSSVTFVDAPRDAPPPTITRHSAWLQPFEVLTRAIGVPGLKEVDPTTWIALLVPLMFGYMCGDVGHGLVIAAAGMLLTRRWPMGRLLVTCGLAAAGFGFIFGDIFGFEHVLEPLWVRPLSEPLVVLLAPVLAGTLVMSLGILLHAVETCWRGHGKKVPWLADTAQLFVYWGLILTLVDGRFGWLALGGVALCVTHRLLNERTPAAVVVGFGQLIGSTFELLLNTISFARVGAFALAHAALESVVIILADGTSSLVAAAIIIVLGNLVVIVTEGIVVSVQTTRLVLFEFFVRFFEGKGRAFEPASAPPKGSGPTSPP
jgi:V/A-type H+-transporting ATPase subunit I